MRQKGMAAARNTHRTCQIPVVDSTTSRIGSLVPCRYSIGRTGRSHVTFLEIRQDRESATFASGKSTESLALVDDT